MAEQGREQGADTSVFGTPCRHPKFISVSNSYCLMEAIDAFGQCAENWVFGTAPTGLMGPSDGAGAWQLASFAAREGVPKTEGLGTLVRDLERVSLYEGSRWVFGTPKLSPQVILTTRVESS